MKEEAYNPTEEVEQLVVTQWLRLHRIRFHASPNGGYRSWREGARLKALGCSAGFPDIMIFDAPPAHAGMKGVAIEMKRRQGGTVSEAQKEWLGYLSAAGWHSFVAYGADAAIQELERLGFEKGKK